jgi:hypothetical protein
MTTTRRQLLALTAAAVTAPAVLGTGIGAAAGNGKIKAVAFDALTIFDTRPVTAAVKALFPDKGEELSRGIVPPWCVAVSATRDPNGGFAVDALIKKSK